MTAFSSGSVLIHKLSDGVRVAGKLALLSRSQWWPANKVEDWQQRQLTAILNHAVSCIPYYVELNLELGNLKGAAALNRFPLLTKDIIQAQGLRMRDPAIDPDGLHFSTTSGSSGQPTTTWFDRDAWLLCKYALKIRRTLQGGSLLGERLMIFGEPAPGVRSPPPEVQNLWAYRALRLSVFLPVDEQFSMMISFAPTIIYGAPSALKELCDYANERQLPLPTVRTVFLSSELITSQLRAQLTHDLNCRVIGVYGSTEFKEVAWQCGAGRYHLNFESVYVENLASDRPDSEPRIVLTTLVNRAMPLIRFDIGDYARIGSDPCECGRESPWLAYIAGRQVEYLQLADGRRISPYLLTTHIETLPGLRQYQVVQHENGSIELRVIFLGGNAGHDDDIRELGRILDSLVGPETRSSVTPVEVIQRTAAGKHQVVMREN